MCNVLTTPCGNNDDKTSKFCFLKAAVFPLGVLIAIEPCNPAKIPIYLGHRVTVDLKQLYF